ncbi:MAG TPA: hypothetical protein VMR37_08410 [Rhabdochlamydiaceae bacterium]|nr:hypothetical protein [Rhabdochlamydiaceae bacterium]
MIRPLDVISTFLPYLTLMGTLAQIKRHFSSPKFDPMSEDEDKIKALFRPFCEQHNLRKDIQFFSSVRITSNCISAGTNSFGLALLFFNPDMGRGNNEAFCFATRSGLLSIKMKTSLVVPLAGYVAGFATVYFFSKRIHTLAVCFLAITVRKIACRLMSMYLSNKKDKANVAHCTKELHLGRIHLYTAMLKANVEFRTMNLWNRLTITETGELRFAPFINLSQRIEHSKAVFRQSGTPYVESSEDIAKQEKLKKHFVDFEKARKESAMSQLVTALFY